MAPPFKILFVALPLWRQIPPLASYRLQSYLKKYLPSYADRISYQLLRVYNYEYLETANIAPRIAMMDPNLVCFSGFVWNLTAIQLISHALKIIRPSLPIVLGGREVTRDRPDLSSVLKDVDLFVHGEGEATFCETVASLMDGRVDLEGVLGLSWRRSDGQCVHNEARPLIADLSTIPSYLVGADACFDVDEPGSSSIPPVILLETSRGCPYQCGYCSVPQGSRCLRYFPLEVCLEETAFALGKRVPDLYFVDSTFHANPARAEKILQFCAEHNRGTAIKVDTRPEHIDREMAELMYRAGVRMVDVGIQTTHRRTESAILRRNSLRKVSIGIQALHASGIDCAVQLIAGLPFVDYDALLSSYDFAARSCPDCIGIFGLQLLPGTALRRRAQEFGYQYTDYPPYEAMSHASSDLADFRRQKLFGRVVSWAEQIAVRPFLLLSNHSGLPPSKVADRWVRQLLQNERARGFFELAVHEGPEFSLTEKTVAAIVRESLLDIAREFCDAKRLEMFACFVDFVLLYEGAKSGAVAESRRGRRAVGSDGGGDVSGGEVDNFCGHLDHTTEVHACEYMASNLFSADDYRQVTFESMQHEKEYVIFRGRSTFFIPEPAMQLARLFESRRPVRSAIAEFAAANGLDIQDESSKEELYGCISQLVRVGLLKLTEPSDSARVP